MNIHICVSIRKNRFVWCMHHWWSEWSQVYIYLSIYLSIANHSRFAPRYAVDIISFLHLVNPHFFSSFFICFSCWIWCVSHKVYIRHDVCMHVSNDLKIPISVFLFHFELDIMWNKKKRYVEKGWKFLFFRFYFHLHQGKKEEELKFCGEGLKWAYFKQKTENQFKLDNLCILWLLFLLWLLSSSLHTRKKKKK